MFEKIKTTTENNHFDVSTKNYEQGAITIARVAEGISNIPIPQETLNDWKILLSSMRIIDDRLDRTEELNERKEFANKIIDSLNDKVVSFHDDEILNKAKEDVVKLISTLDDKQRKSFTNSISNILEITEKIKTEESIKQYISLANLEGQITSRIFMPFLPEEFRKSDNYKKLLHMMSRLGRIGNSFDNLIDLNSDYDNNKSKIKPNIFNKMLILGSILSNSKSISKDIITSNSILKELMSCTTKHIKHSFIKK